MVSSKNMIRSVFWTFIIGMIAGISPFLFMQLLPALLNPSLRLDSPSYLAILLTGVLVGMITSIIFATKFENKEPQDVFFYALGIPAILIATVTNISTEFKAVSKVSEVKESLTSAVLNPPRPEMILEVPKLLSPPKPLDKAPKYKTRPGPKRIQGIINSFWPKPMVILWSLVSIIVKRQPGTTITNFEI